MKILAVEFSSEQRGIAVLEGELGNSSGAVLGRAVELGGRRALELVELALKEAGCEREEIDCIAVGLGPGSYTGIRGAIALAQGWQLGRAIKLCGISSVECMAAQAQKQQMFGAVNVVVDAQRNEFYLARYQITSSSRTELQPLHITSAAAVQQLLAESQNVIGPEIQRWFPKAIDLYPDSAVLGQLALAKASFSPGESIEPIYLRETTFKKAPPPRQIL